jgi:hypothetical protein
MAYTPNLTTGNGSVTDFQVTFPYLRQAHVGIKVNGGVVAKTWVNAGFVRVSPAPGAGISVEVYRDTPSVPLATLQDNKPIPAASYNDLVKQALYFAEEQAYLTAKGTAGDRVQTGLDRAAVAADKATVAADKATVAADKGTVAADKATVAADKATTSGYKDAAATSVTNAGTQATNAAGSATLASKWATEVEDTPVTTGPNKFSAFHWAQKAAASAAAAASVILGNIATTIHSATAKATPVDADEVGLVDSAASFGLKRLTWADLKANVRSYLVATATVWTAQQQFKVSGVNALNTYVGSIGAPMTIANTVPSVGPAVIEFHRPGVYASMFGLDTDNKWKVGGWSAGLNSYEVLHMGNLTTTVPQVLSAACATLTDWNNATGNGKWMALSAANAPSTGWYFGEVISSGSWVQQTVRAFTVSSNADGQVYRRWFNGSAWGTWFRVYENAGELVSLSKSNSRTQTAAVTLSGAATDITGIPSWATEVTVNLTGASYNATGELLIQLGTAGGVQASGYHGLVWALGGTSASHSTGVRTMNTAATDLSTVVVTFRLQNPATNTWTFTCHMALNGTAFSAWSAGGVTLSGALDRVRLTTIPGTPTADGGTMSIQYS